MRPLRHIAIIMDGNGRWAQAKGHNRFFGHIKGAQTAKKMIEECARLKIPCLTLFTFSNENWGRPKEEVFFLMKLLTKRLLKEKASLLKNNIRFYCVGDISRLPAFAREIVESTIRDTAHCTGMKLVFALSYGGKQELTRAVEKIALRVQIGELSPADITEETIQNHLETSHLPDPDLIIRTSGEHRISNFYLWQAAYSELHFVEKLWPDFNIEDLHSAISVFNKTERRFGRTSEQLKSTELLVDNI